MFVSVSINLPPPIPIVCMIIPLIPGSATGPFFLQTRGPAFPSLTPPPTPLSATAAQHYHPFSSRRSPSYESSILLRDLAPPAQFEPQPDLLDPQFPTADTHHVPALCFSPHPPSPIPLITSPLPVTCVDPFPPLPSSSLTSVTSGFDSLQGCSSWTAVAPDYSHREPNCPSLSEVTSEGFSHSEMRPRNVSPCSAEPGQPEPFALPVSPPVAASLSSECLPAQVAFGCRPASTLPSVSPSGSCCPSPGPSSPPPPSLSPCPVCQCTCAPSVPAPAHKHSDPSTMELLI